MYSIDPSRRKEVWLQSMLCALGTRMQRHTSSGHRITHPSSKYSEGVLGMDRETTGGGDVTVSVNIPEPMPLVYTHTCTHAHTHAHTRAHTHALRTHAHTHARTHARMHTHTQPHPLMDSPSHFHPMSFECTHRAVPLHIPKCTCAVCTGCQYLRVGGEGRRMCMCVEGEMWRDHMN